MRVKEGLFRKRSHVKLESARVVRHEIFEE